MLLPRNCALCSPSAQSAGKSGCAKSKIGKRRRGLCGLNLIGCLDSQSIATFCAFHIVLETFSLAVSMGSTFSCTCREEGFVLSNVYIKVSM